jgi:Na+/proline symporter
MRSKTSLLAVACLAGVAVTHLVDLPDKLEEAHYMAALFCALILASVGLAGLLLAGRRTAEALVAAGVLSALTVAGFILSRTVGLPQLEDHVGMWGEPAGIASLVFEGVLIALAILSPASRRAASGHAVRRAPAPQP